MAENSIAHMPHFRSTLQKQNISREAIDLICKAWKTKTGKTYDRHIKSYITFCNERGVNPFQADLNTGLDFLSKYFNTGIKYGSVNSARSALSTYMSINNVPFGKHNLVCKLMKGVFESRPSFPRYAKTWDVKDMLTHISTLGPVINNDLKTCTLRLAILLCLTSGQRDQAIKYLNIDTSVIDDQGVTFFIPNILKTTKPGKHLPPFVIKRYTHNPDICTVHHLETYLNKTKNLRGDFNEIIISYKKPHRPVTVSTVSRWCKTIMTHAGIDTKLFTSHSTRSASASNAKRAGLSFTEINKFTNWSQADTFQFFYDKPIYRTIGEAVRL